MVPRMAQDRSWRGRSPIAVVAIVCACCAMVLAAGPARGQGPRAWAGSTVAKRPADGERRESVDPMSVFEAQAGSASTKLSVSRKKALYGYADLIVDRILERRGYAGLHRIATTARQQGRTQIPRQWLLDAAELTRDPESWQQALLEGLGPQELEELVRMQPMLLGDMLVDFLLPLPQGADLDALLGGTSMTICAQPEAASINLLAIPEFRHSVRARLARLQDKADS